jgi:exopolyphosphatase/guanosine-5'-triphosphate,3'-diphosphate pyrophosphatase
MSHKNPQPAPAAAPAVVPPLSVFPIRLAAVDVGSNAIRLLVAEFAAPDRIRVLAAERAPVRLGRGAFLTGRLTAASIKAALAALERFQRQIKRLGAFRVRAVATSAVRESANGAQFLKRVRRETGLKVEVISGSEEARLVYLAVKNSVPLGEGRWIIADLGGGSVEISLADASGVIWTESHNLGAVRLLEELAGGADDDGRFGRLLNEYVATLRKPAALRDEPPAGMIATGGNIEALAELAGEPARPGGAAVLPAAKLRKMIALLSRLPYRQRVDSLGLHPDRADVILPAAIVYARLAQAVGAAKILVPFVGVRDGILLDLMDDLVSHERHADRQDRQIYTAALALGRRHQFEEPHAVHVARLALSLFDQLRDFHGLDDADRRLLTVAALLHDVGVRISFQKHHKHSLYLISQSDLPGVSARQMQLAANIARYHRKTEPTTRHESFAALTDPERERVTKLAAILRLADALDREHGGQVQAIRVRLEPGRLTLELVGDGDLLLEQWALQKKSALFARVFRVKVRAALGRARG